MVPMRLNQLLRHGAIASLVLISGIACQSSPTPPTPTDQTTESPTEAPGVDTGAPTEQSPTNEITSPGGESTAPEQTDQPGTTTPPQTAATVAQTCSVSAFVADTDPAGLNVRGGPGSNFEVIDTLPTNAPVEVSIVGVTDGWFLVNEAFSQSQQELEQPGWIYGPLLGVTTTSLDINDPEAPASLYESPDGFSNVKAEVPKFTEVTLVSCSGNWLQVQAGDTTGWLAVGDQCSNPTATCP